MLKFVMEIEALSFLRSAEAAGRAQRHPDAEARGVFRSGDAAARRPCSRCTRSPQEAFRDQSARPGRRGGARYLDKRGVDAGLIAQFGSAMPTAPGASLLRKLQERNFNAEQLEQSGLVAQPRRRQLLRPLPQSPDVSDPQRIGQGDRLRRARARSERSSQVFKLAGNAASIRRATCCITCIAPRKAFARRTTRCWWKATWM